MASLNAAAVRERYLRVRERPVPASPSSPRRSTFRSPSSATLVEAGVEVVGENRAQDLVAKHAVYGDAFRWHFIGHLQSNKARLVDSICELVHSLDTESTARRLTVPALLEVNLSGEATKAGVAPDAIGGWLERVPVDPRPHDDAAAGGRPGGLAALVPSACGARRRARPRRALDGHVAGLAGRASRRARR